MPISESPPSRIATALARALAIDVHELPAVAAGMALFFLLFCGYFMLRPVREAMGIAGGVENLQWLFTATFVATLAVLPLFGWLASRVARRRILGWTYAFCAATLFAFAAAFAIDPDGVWLARGFYVWVSVFNLLVVSVAWSVCADLMPSTQAKRVFALMAAGASAGGLCGPLLTVVLVHVLGHTGLLLLSASLLLAAIAAAEALQRWRARHPLPADDAPARARPLGGNPFAGLRDLFASPYLTGIAVFVLLLTSVTTFLYFEQARLVEATFALRVEQTRVFGVIDAVVQALAVLTQLFVTGRIAQRLGVGVLLVAVPLVMAAAFLWFALAPVFAVLAVVIVVRRAGEYALVRPRPQMLFTVVPSAQKYKAKNAIDTLVYRGGDALSAWVKTGVDALAQQPAIVALLGAGVALAWAATGASLARAQRRSERAHEIASSQPTTTL